MSTWAKCVIVGFALLALGLIPRKEASPTSLITYRVTGTAAAARMMYDNETNGNSYLTAGLEWDKSVILPPGATAYLTAQSETKGENLVAEILYKGQVIERSESSGDYCIATVGPVKISELLKR